MHCGLVTPRGRTNRRVVKKYGGNLSVLTSIELALMLLEPSIPREDSNCTLVESSGERCKMRKTMSCYPLESMSSVHKVFSLLSS